MTTQKEARRLIELSGAIRTGHFLFTRRDHGTTYISKELLLCSPHRLFLLCAFLAGLFDDLAEPVEIVVAPSVGGIIIGHIVAFHLGCDTESVFAEKGAGGFRFKRSYREKLRGKKTLILDDVINTGGTVYELVTAVMAEGAIVLGIGAFWNRGMETAESLNVPVLRCLVEEVLPSFSLEECPACKDGKPLNTDFGHG